MPCLLSKSDRELYSRSVTQLGGACEQIATTVDFIYERNVCVARILLFALPYIFAFAAGVLFHYISSF